MKEDVPSNPGDVGLFGTPTVVPQTCRGAHAVEELRRRHSLWRSLALDLRAAGSLGGVAGIRGCLAWQSGEWRVGTSAVFSGSNSALGPRRRELPVRRDEGGSVSARSAQELPVLDNRPTPAVHGRDVTSQGGRDSLVWEVHAVGDTRERWGVGGCSAANLCTGRVPLSPGAATSRRPRCLWGIWRGRREVAGLGGSSACRRIDCDALLVAGIVTSRWRLGQSPPAPEGSVTGPRSAQARSAAVLRTAA